MLPGLGRVFLGILGFGGVDNNGTSASNLAIGVLTDLPK